MAHCSAVFSAVVAVIWRCPTWSAPTAAFMKAKAQDVSLALTALNEMRTLHFGAASQLGVPLAQVDTMRLTLAEFLSLAPIMRVIESLEILAARAMRAARSRACKDCGTDPVTAAKHLFGQHFDPSPLKLCDCSGASAAKLKAFASSIRDILRFHAF